MKRKKQFKKRDKTEGQMEWEEEQEITKRGGNLKQRKNGRNEKMIEKVKRIRKKKTEFGGKKARQELERVSQKRKKERETIRRKMKPRRRKVNRGRKKKCDRRKEERETVERI